MECKLRAVCAVLAIHAGGARSTLPERAQLRRSPVPPIQLLNFEPSSAARPDRDLGAFRVRSMDGRSLGVFTMLFVGVWGWAGGDGL